MAFGASLPGTLWSHNDGGHDPTLHALSTEGHPLGTFTLLGAANRDWEDIATGRCGTVGCIYVADTGDNEEVRSHLDLYRVAEPTSVEEGGVLPSLRFPMRLPGGPRDIEAMFVLPEEQIFLLSKGRSHPVTLYRYPPPLRPGEEITLEEVQTLTKGPALLPHQVTGAGASPDGAVVAVRTYRSLSFYRMVDGRLALLDGGRVDLRTLQEAQGEGVAIGPGQWVALTSEAGGLGGSAALNMLRCGVTIGG